MEDVALNKSDGRAKVLGFSHNSFRKSRIWMAITSSIYVVFGKMIVA